MVEQGLAQIRKDGWVMFAGLPVILPAWYVKMALDTGFIKPTDEEGRYELTDIHSQARL